jgi:hypothetical protein
MKPKTYINISKNAAVGLRINGSSMRHTRLFD